MTEEYIFDINKKNIYLRLNLQLFAEGGSADKTEEPTAKRLKDARDEGQVAKSQELVTAGMLFALFLSIKFFATFIRDNLMKAFPESYNTMSVYAVENPNSNFIVSLINKAIVRIIITSLPILIFALVAALFVNLIQVKWNPTTKPLQPKADKLNPMTGLKRMFSAEKLFDLIKAIIKIILIFWMAYSAIKDEADKIKILYELELIPAIAYICNFIVDLGFKISGVYLIIGFADFLYHKWKFHNDMKMSKQEVKDEFKQQEGDPQVKGKIKSKMREASQRRMMKKVPDADVVITNPTHFACAIKYDKEKSKAPVLVAKGADYIAQKIKDIAKENRVPIVENKALARMLYFNVDLDAEIPESLYAMTAEVLAYVYSLK